MTDSFFVIVKEHSVLAQALVTVSNSRFVLNRLQDLYE